MRKHSQKKLTNENIFLEKIYLSHFIRNGCERVMCERWVRDWTNCNIMTPTSSFVVCSTSFSFCWAAQSGVLRANSPLLGDGSLYSILSPTNWLQTNSNSLSHRVISLFDIHLLPVRVTSAPNSTHPQSRLYPDIFDRIHLSLDWRLGRRSICYIYTYTNKPTEIDMCVCFSRCVCVCVFASLSQDHRLDV